MKTNKITIVFFSLLIIIGSVSCKKNRGCTDKESTNYNADAQEDDGSCNYVAYVVFWFNQASANHLIGAGYTNLKCSIDGAVVGNTQASNYFNSVPSCGQSGSLTVTEQLGSNKTKTISYSILDEVTSTVIWTGNIDLTSGICSPKYLAY